MRGLLCLRRVTQVWMAAGRLMERQNSGDDEFGFAISAALEQREGVFHLFVAEAIRCGRNGGSLFLQAAGECRQQLVHWIGLILSPELLLSSTSSAPSWPGSAMQNVWTVVVWTAFVVVVRRWLRVS